MPVSATDLVTLREPEGFRIDPATVTKEYTEEDKFAHSVMSKYAVQRDGDLSVGDDAPDFAVYALPSAASENAAMHATAHGTPGEGAAGPTAAAGAGDDTDTGLPEHNLLDHLTEGRPLVLSFGSFS